jgi:aspartyl-tRNA(Asn)/glutamyl-tRNA(Gln) amidotransferase subunit B
MGSGAITRAQAKEALRDALRSGKSVGELVEARGLEALSDQGAIEAVIERVVARRPDSLDEARSDKKSFSYLVGQVLKEEPRAQPAVVAKLLAQRLRGDGKKS